MTTSNSHDVVIVGAGFTGLTAALQLSRAGRKVLIVEADHAPGGLAGTFEFRDGVRIEKFYHHWFNNDLFVPRLVESLGLQDQILTLPSRTGMFYNGRIWRLSSPLDVLRFSALSMIGRLRLGWLLFQVRKVKNWKTIEHLTIREWLEPLCGEEVFRVVWEPLIKAKFSVHADTVNAVWFWKKLVLRGNTRDPKGGEQLAYFRGGFGTLAQAMADEIVRLGGEIRYGVKAVCAHTVNGKVEALETSDGRVSAHQFLFTPAFPIVANILAEASSSWIAGLKRIRYLGNICLVLELTRSLSSTYWLNVNDPGFPFVGVIEHTNLDTSEHYNGKHIVFLSRYIAVEDPVWTYGDKEYLDLALQHLTRMFPDFDRAWLADYRIWRADYAQPVTERDYSTYVPGRETPFNNAWVSTMAQIYPEDRGTNYAIREGEEIATLINSRF